jgi:hypothetical protein
MHDDDHFRSVERRHAADDGSGKVEPVNPRAMQATRNVGTTISTQFWRHPRFVCPCCAGAQVDRVARRTAWDYLLGIFYIYPFKCESCTHSFRMFEWGVRYRRQRRI